VAVMYRDAGIRTNAIAPGATMTGIAVTADPAAHGPQVLARYRQNIGRLANANEQAAAIVFLASDAAANINGVVLPVDDGWAAV
jgi:NAD(P)-dependent dehydrogenase (short-subunit alcohol dehydrogenase family)